MPHECYVMFLLSTKATSSAFWPRLVHKSDMPSLEGPKSETGAKAAPCTQVFYQEFGSLMMRQPLIGFEFTTYAPIVLVPYIILLVFNVFNRMAAFCLRSPTFLFEDDWELHSPYATTGTRLLQLELENFATGKPMGLTISPQGNTSEQQHLTSWKSQCGWTLSEP